MYKAKVTKNGARRTGLPEGAIIEYDAILPLGQCIDNFYLDGVRRGRILQFTGKGQGCILITYPPEVMKSDPGD